MRYFKHLLCGAVFACALAALDLPANAQFVTLTHTGITDLSGGVLASGRECLTPVDNNQNPIPASYPGGTITKAPKCQAVINGAMTPLEVVSSAVTNPLNLCYLLTIQNTANGSFVIGPNDGYSCIQPTANENLNTLAPNLPANQVTLQIGSSTVGGSMVYPGAGVACSTGSAWCTSYGSGNTIPANYISTLNQNTTGYAGGLAGGVLGSWPYQTAPNTTAYVSPNTTTTKQFYSQTGTGSAGAAPALGPLVAADVPTLNQNTTGQSGTVATVSGLVSAGAGIALTGSGTSASPYSVAASLGGTLSTSNVALGTGAGTSPSSLAIAGSDANFQVSFHAGTSPAAGGTIFTVTFTATRGHTSYCTVSAASGYPATTIAGVQLGSASATTMTLSEIGGYAITASQTYIYNVSCP